MKSELKLKLWRLFLRAVRAVTLSVDDWIQAQEILLRQKAASADTSAVALAKAEVDPAASAAREKVCRAKNSQQRRLTAGAVNGARVSRKGRAPRLVYQHGEFVRQGGAL